MTIDSIPGGLRLPTPLPTDLSLMDLIPYLTGIADFDVPINASAEKRSRLAP